MPETISATFPILRGQDAELVGRKKLLSNIWESLTKSTPDNLSVVGPRYIGKTMLLKALAEQARNEGPYALVLYWELAYESPQCDEAFATALCDRMCIEMNSDPTTFKDYRDELVASKSFDLLKEVMDLLESDGKPVLMIWDGFDKPLNEGRLSGQLFGQLRNLFYGKQHKLVTATRATNTELARNKQVEDSPLWNILQQVKVGAFDESDTQSATEKVGLTFSKGGLTELENWTGNHPVLLLSLLNHLEPGTNDEVDNIAVNQAAELAKDGLAPILERIWSDCSINVQDCFRDIVERGPLKTENFDSRSVRYLCARGLAIQNSGNVQASCRYIAEYTKESKIDAGTIGRLFGPWESYKKGIRTILELRIKQVPVVDNRLHKLVNRGLEDIPDEPSDCLNSLTNIEERALDLIWQFEFGDKTVPVEIQSYWASGIRGSDRFVERLAGDWRVPTERYAQLALLQRLTGSCPNFDPRAKMVSKDTYVLLNAIHQFRNRSQHAEGQEIHVGVAISAATLY